MVLQNYVFIIKGVNKSFVLQSVIFINLRIWYQVVIKLCKLNAAIVLYWFKSHRCMHNILKKMEKSTNTNIAPYNDLLTFIKPDYL